MKKLTKIVSTIAAITATAAISAAPCLAAYNVSVTNVVDNSLVGGDANIATYIQGISNSINTQTTNMVNSTAIGGDLNIANLSNLAGNSVTDVKQNVVNNVVTKGNTDIKNITNTIANSTTAVNTNAITNVITGNTSVANIIDTNGISKDVTAVLQNVQQNTINYGSLDITNLLK